MYHATLPYLRKALKRLLKWVTDNSVKDVGLPKIGAGLGKLSWQNDVKPLFEAGADENGVPFRRL